MEIQGFTLINTDKLERALNGTPMSDSTMKGGVGDGAYFENGVWMRNGEELSAKEVETLEFSLLAEYDKLGGLIKKGDDKVKTGSFFNFTAKKPHAKPQVVYIFNVNGKFVDVPEGTDLPGEVKAVKILEASAKKVKVGKKK
jgi:hypothetical protein